ncbi:MAG: Re/Si-specific NAD(P)(+) transhydrogenase subunit alpha [Planctomycetota bacterium]|nr:Re/Si-specific NAD(P)(+) transhydrogenase subunit alpha [Planctomycetota bacterium]
MPTVFVPKETLPGETRVVATPESVKQFVKRGLAVEVETGAGAKSHFPDESYEEAGASIVPGSDATWGKADLVLKGRPPTAEQVGAMHEGAILVSFVEPSKHLALVGRLRERGITCLAIDHMPRISRAQSMDVLSSQATVGGYKAVLLGASHLGKLCPLLMTAAGTILPARVVVFGAGVAGLMAIATARRLGCVVEATDVRLAVKEQVESLGARFIDVPGMEDMEDERGYAKEATKEFLERQREEVAKRVAEADMVITTAQVPGRKAPLLVTAEMVRSMRPGSVIVDMAVESGGNCELSELDKVVVVHDVTIIGIANIPTTVPLHASELYARNVLELCKLFITDEGELKFDWEDEVLAGCRLTHAGEVFHEPTAAALAGGVQG